MSESVWYNEFLAERREILRHKWIESEKAGYDIGFERALLDWTLKYRSVWRVERYRRFALNGCGLDICEPPDE
jgi:hypothetical protein